MTDDKDAGNDLLVWYDRDGSVGGIVDPIDWPTESGWYWMETSLTCKTKKPPILGMLHNDGTFTVYDASLWLWTQKQCEYQGARFIRAHVPTFPPREVSP